ncbi:RiPP maturation radical SAM C-methyltransferase [Nonomuraea ferruginea]|uniref:RiPP maturation radical SAM C-methyltransferase n=1 Tax=Nonomuraea ferruginea TaxID=46174 RepID=A0ABT4T7I7_9ACTN|nr:RiPP maturation radical SAM C-methyltransferase [Nonomuraea ferruginea]MDA0645481.1 RiPP maturation radical SAM C-methyltransferase [Nonomuraea ferruginea]
MSTYRVLLVSMPWHGLDRPSLGLSLLQAALRRDGVACDVRYLGFDLADLIGLPDYQWVQGGLPHTAFAGEWLFAAALHGERPAADAAYDETVLRGVHRQPQETIARLRRLRGSCARFLDRCLASIAWTDYDLVGFTSTFEQNLASLALARRVKERHPGVVTVFGGANWEGDMGHELHARFPFVDVVCGGEADVSFPALVQRMRAGAAVDEVPGLIVRRDGASVRTPPAAPITDLDALPVPCFDAYFDALRDSAEGAAVRPRLLLETSRGCWWGARHHCTFCGLNGQAMTFRSKSPERVLDEIEHLTRRHGLTRAGVVDNILDMRYFTTLLPALAAAGAPADLFYEVKANLSAAQVKLLADAGVREIQPGLESLSDHVLALMRKGTTALRNIQLLKWCAEFGVTARWNLLFGFPGETAEDYASMLPLLDACDFLQPPDGMDAIRLDRFSPFHQDPERFGMTGVRPMEVYRCLYPFPDEALRRIAYYFDFDYADGMRPLDHAGPVMKRVRRWIERGGNGTLALLAHPDGGLVLVDTRDERTVSFRLTGWRAAVYARCDRGTAERAAVAASTAAGATAEEVLAFLADCLRRRLMVRTDDQWLALGIRVPARTSADSRP